MTPAKLLAPTYIEMLTALSNWLDKARTQMQDDADDLLLARLAPDMFPLSTQIRFACVQAYEGMFRLKDEPFPQTITALLDEGRNADERPGTILEAQTRIEETLSQVRNMSETISEGDGSRPVVHALPNGMTFDFTLDQYARDWAIGQFYFHVMIAYAIMRHHGVQLGKADYVAHALAHLRPETMQQT